MARTDRHLPTWFRAADSVKGKGYPMKNVLEYLEQTAERFPEKRAVTDPEGSLTFAGLLERARKAGTYLARYTSPGQPVGIYMSKSKDAYAAMLGIVYAGCFSVFLNTEQGTLRLRKMVETSGLSIVLTDRPGEAAQTFCPEDDGRAGTGCAESGGVQTGDAESECAEPGCARSSGTSRARLQFLDTAEAFSTEVDRAALDAVRVHQTDTDPLYCNFTSGSTGTPKGVLVSHRSVIDFMNYFPELFHITKDDVIGNQAPFDFDVSVKDIYSSLKTGAELVLIPRKYFTVITNLMDYLDEKKVTTLTWAVSALCLVVQFRGFTYKVPSSIRRVLFSGEVMPERFLRAWMEQYPDAEFVNLYGPSEITCNCTYYRVQGPAEDLSGKPLPIGVPFPNEKVFLLDEKGRRITESGRSGEICVSGSCLALGYLNAPEVTRKAFCPSPLETRFPEQMYRTGDLGYYREDGQLCFSGRADFQIKLFGHRIELEEVEGALNTAHGVERGFCVFNREKNRLEACYCGQAEPRALKGELLKLLPQYMVPSRFHHVQEIPLTDHGKMDRRRVLEQLGEGAKEEHKV